MVSGAGGIAPAEASPSSGATQSVSPAPAARGSGPSVPAGHGVQEAPLPLGSAGGAARPIIVPASPASPSTSAGAGATSARPPLSPNTGAARAGTLADALNIGTRPLLAKAHDDAVGVDDFSDSVRDLRVKVKVIARGHERLATALQSVSGAVSNGFMEVLDIVQRLAADRNGTTGPQQGTSQLAQLMARINSVKQAFRLRLEDRAASANCSADVYFNTDRTWVELVHVTEDVLGVDRDEALNWLLKTVQLPGRRDANVLVTMRACVPILCVKPQLMQIWKQTTVSAFFEGIGITLESMTSDLATLWLNSDTYIDSELGKPCMVGATGRLLCIMGGGDMVIEPTTVCGRPVVRCTLGHVALASCFVRSVLKGKAGLRPRRRAGVGEGIFDQ